MLKWILFAVVAVGVHAWPVAQANPPRDETPRGQVVCPVMGIPVKDLDKAARSEYKGRTYYFCCPSCKEKFDKDPEKYVVKQGRAHEGHKDHPQTCRSSSPCDCKGR